MSFPRTWPCSTHEESAQNRKLPTLAETSVEDKGPARDREVRRDGCCRSRGTLRPGGIRPVTPWSTRANNRSPRYTTRFSDLMEVVA
ncbi:DUF4113 domain-containing protein [Brevundimonas sp. EYE_349]|nr:DUF4113 domain-containing protein [Brevundimonas sp. EYE_349]